MTASIEELGLLRTLALAALTITFAVWAVATVAQTALMGLLIPVLLMIYLVSKHAKYTRK